MRAIGVGTGIDVCYPKENKKLFEKVLKNGAVISELSSGSHPAPENCAREVFGVPGNVTQEISFAPKQLIKQGAKLVSNTEDVSRSYPRRFVPLWCQRKRSNPNSATFLLRAA